MYSTCWLCFIWYAGHTFGMMDKPVHRRLSIVSRITQFYKDVKQRKRELYGESEPAYDTGYNTFMCMNGCPTLYAVLHTVNYACLFV